MFEMMAKKFSKVVLASVLAVIATVSVAELSMAAPSGTSAWGDEPREVYNALVAAGATRVMIPEGPTVIVDRIDCAVSVAGAELASAKCKFVGDPKLNTADGAIALRLAKGLIKMGVNKKTIDATSATVGVNSLQCGILHNLPQVSDSTEAEEASCFFIDNN